MKATIEEAIEKVMEDFKKAHEQEIEDCTEGIIDSLIEEINEGQG